MRAVNQKQFVRVVLILFLFYMNILSASFWLDQSSRQLMGCPSTPWPTYTPLILYIWKFKLFKNLSFPCLLKKYTCSVHVLLTVARYGLQSTNPMLSFASLANNFRQSWKSDDQIIKSGRGEHHKFIYKLCKFVQNGLKTFSPSWQNGAWPQTYLQLQGSHTLNIYYYRNCTMHLHVHEVPLSLSLSCVKHKKTNRKKVAA